MREIVALLCAVVVNAQLTRHTSEPTIGRNMSMLSGMAKESKTDCSDAPSIDIKKICLMYRKGDSMARSRIARQAQEQGTTPARVVEVPAWLQPVPVPGNARGQAAYHPYDCMTLQCLCPFFRGQMRGGVCILGNGRPLTMAYRKEYRMLTDDERNRWHNALNTLKRNGEYDRLSSQHLAIGVASGAHSGPGFLPWHREYLKRVEIALRMIDPSLAIPYWDSVMDQYLPDPRDSIIFSNLFAGETDFYGNVIQGPFAYWRTLEGRSTILRQLGREGSLFNENQINNIVSQNTIENTMAYTAPAPGCPYFNNYGAIEYTHSNIHLWIGGDMKPPSTSANEPIFFMHHSFVDYIWELWRQLKQPKWLRETAYSNDHPACANWQHFSYAAMRPFPYLRNRDGLSNSYTDQMYRYAPRATCSVARPNCGSPYLFCDTRGYPHCVAKIKMNGNCRGFENHQEACYMGRCWWGRCISAQQQGGRRWVHGAKTSETEKISLAEHTDFQMSSAPVKILERAAPLFVDCFNRHPCCSAWASEGQCQKVPEYMSQFCKADCQICTPSYNTSDACTDRHISCSSWKDIGMCRGPSADFMAENCRQSCGKCNLNRQDQCTKDGKVIPLPASHELLTSIRKATETEPRVKKDIDDAKKSRVGISRKIPSKVTG